VFEGLLGVISVMPGYTGGTTLNPTYEQVCTGTTGHVEATRVEFDPTQISFDDLLTIFFATHDPTTLNRQGNDVGTEYRSAIFYVTSEQKTEAEKFIAALTASDPVAGRLPPRSSRSENSMRRKIITGNILRTIPKRDIARSSSSRKLKSYKSNLRIY